MTKAVRLSSSGFTPINPKSIKTIEVNFAELLNTLGHTKSDNLPGKVNESIHDFFKIVADNLCAYLLKGMQRISLVVAESFI